MTMYLVAGRVTDAVTGRTIPGGEVELRQRGVHDPLTTAAIDQRGFFHFGLSDDQLTERLRGSPPDLDLRVLHDGRALPNAKESLDWPPSSERMFRRIAIPIPIEEASTEVLIIDSYRVLLSHEREILERIRRTPNGGRLFLIEPFRLLAEIGVEITPAARDEIVAIHPGLKGISSTPYDALKASRERQSLRFHIRRLDNRARRGQ